MKYNPDLHHRHSIRLQNYDYANIGAYFITICCQNRINHFGNVGAGSACPIMQPDLQMHNDMPIMQPDLQMRTNLQQGQANPAPTETVTANTVNMVNLNEFGEIVDAEWKNLTIKYPNVNTGEYIIMPNHFHGIIEITERLRLGILLDILNTKRQK